MALEGIAVDRHGPATGPVLVLVHGAPDRASAFRQLLPHLAGRSVVTYDRRGYGRSLHAAPARSMDDHARDLLAVIATVDRPCTVVAHSFGSNPTMLAAALEPGAVRAIGLWEPPLVWIDEWPQATKDYNAEVARATDPAAAIEAMYRQLLGPTWEALAPDARDQRRHEGAAFQLDMASELTAPFAFADVVVPALVGHGTETGGGHVEGAEWLAAALPDARLHVVEGAGHFAHRTHPAAFAAFALEAAALGAA